jgi:signal transduction histidine kinase
LHRGEGRPPFTWRDAALLEALASTIAVAIDNERLAVELSTKSEEVRRLAAHHLRRLEDERQHIARELHDEAGQALVGVKLSLQAAARLVAPEQVALKEQLAHLRVQLNEAASQLKTMARNLRPPTLDRLGLDMALAQLAEDTRGHAGCYVKLDVDWMPERLSPEIETALFRVTQEALTNAAKHAKASEITVLLGSEEGRVNGSIEDNGAGFDPMLARRSAHGLTGMRYRVKGQGGTLTVTSRPGHGTQIAFWLPTGTAG